MSLIRERSLDLSSSTSLIITTKKLKKYKLKNLQL